jgi:hypothetical protein
LGFARNGRTRRKDQRAICVRDRGRPRHQDHRDRRRQTLLSRIIIARIATEQTRNWILAAMGLDVLIPVKQVIQCLSTSITV